MCARDVVEQPHARALDLERPPGDLGDAAERLVERELGDAVVGEELEQAGLLPAHAALGDHRRRHLLHRADEADRLAGGVAEHAALGVEPARDAAHVDDAELEVGLVAVRGDGADRRLDAHAVGGQQAARGRSGSRRRSRRSGSRAAPRGGARGPCRPWRDATPTARCRRRSARSGRMPRVRRRGGRARGRGRRCSSSCIAAGILDFGARVLKPTVVRSAYPRSRCSRIRLGL